MDSRVDLLFLHCDNLLLELSLGDDLYRSYFSGKIFYRRRTNHREIKIKYA